MSATRLRERLLWVALVAIHPVVVVGLWFAARIGRPRFVGLGLYVVVALLLFDALLAIGRTSEETETFSLVTDARVPTLGLLGSISVLAVFGPGIVFYFGVTVVLVLVLFRAVALDEGASSTRANLALVCGASAVMLASQVFSVAYYVNTADTLVHTTVSILLRDGGSLQAIADTRYLSYSAFHVVSGVGMQFSGLDPRVFMSVFVIAIFQVSLLALYLFVRYLSSSQALGLVSIVLASVNISFFHYGRIAHYQSMSFVLYALFLFLLFRGVWSSRDVIVTVPILAVWIATHHVSVLMAIVVGAVPIGYLTVRWLVGRSEPHHSNTTLLFTTFCLMFGVYWAIVTRMFQQVIGWVLVTSPAARGVASVSYLARSYSSLETLLARSVPFFVDSLHYSFLLAFAALGLWVLLRTDMIEQTRYRLIVFASLPAFALYFPSPIWIPLEGIAEFNRWRLMVLPFLVIVPAIGIKYGVPLNRTKRLRSAVAVLLTAMLVLTMITSAATHPDITDLAGIQKTPQEYLSDQEVTATQFVYAHMEPSQNVYSRSLLRAYLREYAVVYDKPYESGQFRKLKASYTERQLLSESGLTVMSAAAFRGEGFQATLVDLNVSEFDDDVRVSEFVSSQEYRWDRGADSVVYSNGDVVIQYGANRSRAVAG